MVTGWGLTACYTLRYTGYNAGLTMPIKDPEKRRRYFRDLMRKRRAGQAAKPKPTTTGTDKGAAELAAELADAHAAVKRSTAANKTALEAMREVKDRNDELEEHVAQAHRRIAEHREHIENAHKRIAERDEYIERQRQRITELEAELAREQANFKMT